jgi:hypothetical protein
MSLARYNRVVLDSAGEGVAASIEVRSELPGQPLAALYSDRAGSASLANPFTADSDGSFGFHVVGGAYQVRAYTGPSGSPTFEQILRYEAIGLNSESDSISSLTEREVTAAGAVTVDAEDADVILINKTVGAATTVNLPLSAARTRPVEIVDAKGDANTNNITIVPQSGESIFATVDYQAVIDGNGGKLKLTPKRDGTGWH